MAIKREDVLKLEQIKKELDEHIVGFLILLEKKELEIITPYLDIVSGYYGPVYQSYNRYFVRMNREKIVPKDGNFVYTILSYEKDYILIRHGVGQYTDDIKIPYHYDDKSFNEYCSVFFKKMLDEIEVGKKFKAKVEKERVEYKRKEKNIRAKHKSGKYTYWWEDCPECYQDFMGNSSGTRQVGTGRWEEDPYSFSDAPRDREITKTIDCPCCRGTAGMLVIDKGGWEPEKKPCGKWLFEEYQDDFMTLLTELK